jgi:hypothetical protein
MFSIVFQKINSFRSPSSIALPAMKTAPLLFALDPSG